jgi:LAO/AO transport system kinase
VSPLVEQARHGSIRAASRLISLLEDDPSQEIELYVGMATWPAPRLTVGITGAPGVGKSSVIDGLIAEWRERRPEWRIGVLAVDPSSSVTGGAVLGDRVRMMQHANDPSVFIRSLTNRGHLGGVSPGIRSSIRVMGLAGCDVVVVETTGVGQTEMEIAEVVDVTCVVLAPGRGDDVQLLKAGPLEKADVLVVNQADRPNADGLYGALAVAWGGSLAKAGAVEVLKVSAIDGTGITQLADAIERREGLLTNGLEDRRASALRSDVARTLKRLLLARVEDTLGNDVFDAAARQVVDGRATVEATVNAFGARLAEIAKTWTPAA